MTGDRMSGRPDGPQVDWARWTVVLLKPDCVQQGLVDPVLQRVRAELCLVAVEAVTVTDWQIFTHYWDLFVYRHYLGVDVADCLRRRYVGQQAVIGLGHGARPPADRGDATPGSARPNGLETDPAESDRSGPHPTGLDTPQRVRALLGHFDPSQARPGTIRADFGTDTLAAARREDRLVDNLIHTSDDATASWRDFHIWFGGHRATELLTSHDPATCPTRPNDFTDVNDTAAAPSADPPSDQATGSPTHDPTEVPDP